ncbi:hypothetical protein EV426DRAFT_608023, partial [Tirmania nivea]
MSSYDFPLIFPLFYSLYMACVCLQATLQATLHDPPGGTPYVPIQMFMSVMSLLFIFFFKLINPFTI